MKVEDLNGYRLYLSDVKAQLRDHVYSRSQEAFANGDAARDRISGKEQLAERQSYIRRTYLNLLDGVPGSETALNPRLTGTVKGNGFTIEKLIFESRPFHYVTANLYVPDGIRTPTAAVLFVCGHFDDGKQNPEYQRVCQYLTQAGLVVLAVDPIGQGERHSYYEPELGETLMEGPIYDHDYVGVQGLLAGNPLARYFLHDAMRGIDYLCSRPEVDPARIGVTGNSGGGMQTAMLMLSDPRIAAAAPATFIMSRESYQLAGQAQDAEQIWPGFSAAGLDHEDILIAMAPKPVLILAVASDFFAIEGTQMTYARVKRFWEMHGAGDKVGLFVDQSIHRFTETMAQEAARFFAKHLLDSEPELSEAAVTVFDPKLMWCTVSGKVIGELEQAKTIHDENVELMERLEADLASDPLSRQKGIDWLRQKVTGPRETVPLNPRINPMGHLYQLEVQSVLWMSQKNLYNHAFVFRDTRQFNPNHTPLIALWEGGTVRSAEHFGWIQEKCAGGAAVMVLDVSGTGPLGPNPISPWPIHATFGTIHKLTADLIWLDDSLAAIRVYDVLRSLDVIRMLGIEAEGADVYAVGRLDLYPRLAALLDSRIKAIEAREGIGSLRNLVKLKYYNNYDIYSYLVPGILRHLDV